MYKDLHVNYSCADNYYIFLYINCYIIIDYVEYDSLGVIILQ